jgi:hypothetical protein
VAYGWQLRTCPPGQTTGLTNHHGNVTGTESQKGGLGKIDFILSIPVITGSGYKLSDQCSVPDRQKGTLPSRRPQFVSDLSRVSSNLNRLFCPKRKDSWRMRWKTRFYQGQESILVEEYFQALYCFTQWCLWFKLNGNAHTGLLLRSDKSAFYA